MTSSFKLRAYFALFLAAFGALRADESPRMLHDLGHGQSPSSGRMKTIAGKLGVALADSKTPISAESLAGVRLLYLHAPSTEFSARERESIVGFVRAGGSLLLVLDEERRQSLVTTRVNDIVAPFGLKLTDDLPYLHNCGGLAKAGVINAADREIPHSGGRGVEGGAPFAFVLDKDGKPAEAFAASTVLPNGAKIVVMGELMASLFLGKPDGVRLAGVPRDPSRTTYWGKDSAVFMEELIAWLVTK